MCEANVDNTETMNKKVRNAQIAQFNFIFGKYQQNCCFIQLTAISLLISVVGEKEQANGTVNVRTRDNKVHGERSLEQIKKIFGELAEKRILNWEEFSFE